MTDAEKAAYLLGIVEALSREHDSYNTRKIASAAIKRVTEKGEK